MKFKEKMQLFGKVVTWIVTGIEGLLSWWEEDSLIPVCGMKSKQQLRTAGN